jgi:hypothetical protein
MAFAYLRRANEQPLSVCALIANILFPQIPSKERVYEAKVQLCEYLGACRMG